MNNENEFLNIYRNGAISSARANGVYKLLSENSRIAKTIIPESVIKNTIPKCVIEQQKILKTQAANISGKVAPSIELAKVLSKITSSQNIATKSLLAVKENLKVTLSMSDFYAKIGQSVIDTGKISTSLDFSNTVHVRNVTYFASEFASNKFPEDISIKQIEAVVETCDEEICDLSAEQMDYLKCSYHHDFEKIQAAKTIDDFVVYFDRLNALTDIMPGYRYKADFYSWCIRRLCNGIDMFGDTLAYLFVVLIIHMILKHFEIYNKFLDIIKNFKDQNPLV